MTLQEQISKLEQERKLLAFDLTPLRIAYDEAEKISNEALHKWHSVYERIEQLDTRIEIAKQMLESFEQGKEQSECKPNA